MGVGSPLLLVPMLRVGTCLRTLRVLLWKSHRGAVKKTFPRGAWERGTLPYGPALDAGTNPVGVEVHVELPTIAAVVESVHEGAGLDRPHEREVVLPVRPPGLHVPEQAEDPVAVLADQI